MAGRLYPQDRHQHRKVVGRLDLGSIAVEARNKFAGSETLNGIAYNPASGLVYVTGKLWPGIYELKLPL
jgi:glutaminyl-peptide cyclotransferase